MRCKGYTIEQKKAILDQAKGQYFSCSWVKKDLTERHAVCKKWQTKYLHGAVGEDKNPVAHIPYYYTIAEDAVEGLVPCRIARCGLQPVCAGQPGVEYVFED